jgi:hypothetical protein
VSNFTFPFAVAVFCHSTVFAFGQDVDDARAGAIRFLKGLSAIRAVKLSANVATSHGFESVATIEMRGDSVWISSQNRYGATEAEKTSNDRTAKDTFELNGTDGASVDIFHDGKCYKFDPAMLELRISKSADIQINEYIKSVFPANWYGFHQFQHEVLRFPYLLTNSTTVGEVLDSGNVRFRNTEQSGAFALREVIVDTTRGYTINHYEMSGGTLGTCLGEYKWEKDQESGYWFPIYGKQTTKQASIEHLIAEWTIDKISFDAQDVRSSFAFKESDFPFGSLIRDTSSSEKEQKRYIGGEAGKKEFELREKAARNFRLKRLP